MSYKKAAHVLPQELIKKIQQYVDGECIYIPRTSENKRDWGETTSTRAELRARNQDIYADYVSGMNAQALAEKYFLSEKSIQRIVAQEKKRRE